MNKKVIGIAGLRWDRLGESKKFSLHFKTAFDIIGIADAPIV